MRASGSLPEGNTHDWCCITDLPLATGVAFRSRGDASSKLGTDLPISNDPSRGEEVDNRDSVGACPRIVGAADVMGESGQRGGRFEDEPEQWPSGAGDSGPSIQNCV